MILGGDSKDLCLNILETYFELGLAAPGARFFSREGFKACLGELDHPACNFAADLTLTPNVVAELRDLACKHPSFQVYLLPSDQPRHAEQLLRRAGFEQTHCLAMMQSNGRDAGYTESLEPIQSLEEREQIAEFMVEQFFAGRTNKTRQEIAQLTINAQKLALYSVKQNGKVVSAAMMHRTPGVLGVYNLCVASALRGRGLGQRLLGLICKHAWEQNLRVSLQCEPRLERWYEAQGFEKTGYVDVFALAKDSSRDIIKLD